MVNPRMRRAPRRARLITARLILALVPILLPVAAQAGTPEVPNWRLRCADGSTVDFHEELAKGPVLVSFWALWCKPCLKELPHLDRLAQDYGERLTVLAVNIDSQRSVAKVRPFLKSRRYGLIVPMDTAGDLRRQMQVGGAVPFLVLYDADGNEVYRHTGYTEGDELVLREKVAACLGETAGGGE